MTALFVSLIVFSTDIHARIEAKYLQANAQLIVRTTSLVDAGIERKTEAVTTESARTSALSAQVENLRQNVIDPAANDRAAQQAEQEVGQLLDQKAKAEEDLRSAETFSSNEYAGIKGVSGNSGRPGFGLRYQAAMEQVAKAKSRFQEIEKELNASDTIMQRSHDQLPTFEQTLKAENQKLDQLKGDLAEAIAGREDGIRKAVESTPGHVSWDGGFLSQLRTLEQIAAEDQKIKLVIILIDIVAFGLELAAISAKVLGHAPTTFAPLQARDIYMRAVRIADEMLAELKARETGEAELPEIPMEVSPIVPPAVVDGELDPSQDANNPLQQPAKRKRGRPRKHPLPPTVTGANGSGK